MKSLTYTGHEVIFCQSLMVLDSEISIIGFAENICIYSNRHVRL